MKVVKQKDINLDEVTELLKNGGTIVYPTETTYGLGCDATNEAAVNKIFEIKKRQKNKPVLVIMPHVNMAMDYVDWTPKMEDLAFKYWPGPLTMVSGIKDGIELPSGVVGDDKSLAFRVTNHPLVFEIAQALGKPLVSTSANITSLESPYDIKSVLNMFSSSQSKPDLIINSGTLPHHQPSTVVRVSGDELEVLRQGEIVIN